MYLISRKIKLSLGRLLLKFAIRSAYLGLIIIAFLGPSFGDIKKEIKAIGKDIYIAIDLSASMNVADVSPTRLEKAKFEVGQMMKKFNSDRIGLIIFSDEAFVQCPLTYDHKAVKLFLDGINTTNLSSNGTNLQAPLVLAAQKFSSENSTGAVNSAKVIILVTDGEDFGDVPIGTAIKNLKESSINTIVLGVGSEEGGKIPIGKGYKVTDFGKIVISKLNSKKFKKVVLDNGGYYFEMTPDRNEVKSVVTKIYKMDGILKGTKKIESGANKYFYFLFIALVLIIIDVLIMVKTIKI